MRVMAPMEEEGTSGLNIDDEEDKEVIATLAWIANIINSDGGESQEAGPSDDMKNIQAQHAGRENSAEDLEDAYDLKHNIPQTDTHSADPTCLAILSIFKKLLCFCFF
ncbi:TMV resistance protein N [Spatholobus suberectus]|nr:TMV resistance protein N [Spatholobus suberectus]